MMKHFVTCIAVVFLLLGCSDQKKTVGNHLIEQIEAHQLKKHQLPESLSEIGISETLEGPVFYQKKSESAYTLWYGTSLGESVSYDSISKKWK